MRTDLTLRHAMCVAVAIVLSGWSGSAMAFSSYSDCSGCHPGFRDEGPLHDLHVGSNQMTNNCLLCHANIGDTPRTWTSGDPEGQGCRGCHGVDNGTTFRWSVGLWEHHTNEGVTSCLQCHSIVPGELRPENTLPVYYERNDVNIDDPCATDIPGGEDWDNDGEGLDNDGDLLYDQSDSDCAGTGVEEATPISPRMLTLFSIAPNPVRVGGTDIEYGLVEAADVRIGVYDVTGRQVLDQYLPGVSVGNHTFHFENRDVDRNPLPSGIYIVRIESGNVVASGRIVVLR